MDNQRRHKRDIQKSLKRLEAMGRALLVRVIKDPRLDYFSILDDLTQVRKETIDSKLSVAYLVGRK